ncbi:hypothetical protein KGQ31_02960 [Patescibacteria group bacterium]|nr:hypothetical protein [Patescibacteria group bacterium]
MTSEILEDSIKKALKKLGLNVEKITLEHPDDLANGDYSTNVALSHAKTLGVPPRQLAKNCRSPSGFDLEVWRNQPWQRTVREYGEEVDYWL